MTITLPMADAAEPVTVLEEGTRVRHKQHGLTGTVYHEWNAPGVLSALPYLVRWDNPDRAADLMGMFFLYPSEQSLEPVDVA